MLRHIGQQRLVLVAVACVITVALHHQGANRLIAAHQRHAQPVDAIRADALELTTDLLGQFLWRAHQCAAFSDHVSGGRVAVIVERIILFGQRRIGVGHVDEIGEPHRTAVLGLQHDIEVVRIHQAADGVMHRAEHRGHVALAAGQFGDGVKRTLQPLGALQPMHRVTQVPHRAQLVVLGAEQSGYQTDAAFELRLLHRLRQPHHQCIAGLVSQRQDQALAVIGRGLGCSTGIGQADPGSRRKHVQQLAPCHDQGLAVLALQQLDQGLLEGVIERQQGPLKPGLQKLAWFACAIPLHWRCRVPRLMFIPHGGRHVQRVRGARARRPGPVPGSGRQAVRPTGRRRGGLRSGRPVPEDTMIPFT